MSWRDLEPQTMDVKMVIYLCPRFKWQFQTLTCFPAVKPGLVLEREAEKKKKHSSDWARFQKAMGGIYFPKNWRAEILQPGLEFDNFKPWLQIVIFNCISWMNGSFFGGDDRGFLKEAVKTYLVAPLSNSPILFSIFTSVVYAWSTQ